MMRWLIMNVNEGTKEVEIFYSVTFGYSSWGKWMAKWVEGS